MPRAVRIATVDDAADVAALLDEFARESAEPTPGTEVLTRRVRDAIGGDEGVFVIPEGEPDGMAAVAFRPDVMTGHHTATLDHLYVVASERRSGLGRALLRAAMDAARARDAYYFDLAVGATDDPALALYESEGLINGEPGDASHLYYYRVL
jgi:ribosomal protein S18 acetylase RimI-like enzyme